MGKLTMKVLGFEAGHALSEFGFPRKAGHFIASMTYRHGRLPLAGPGEVINVGYHRLKQVGKVPPEEPRGRRGAI